MFYNFKEEKPTYSLNFYPKNDDVIGIMTMDRLRSICSGLECELAFQKSLMTEEDKELENLKKEVKNLIKAHRKGETPLQSKTYDLLFGSIDNWTASLYDRIVALYRKFEPEMQEIIRHNIPFEIDEQKIRDFVRYRNKTTHGSSKTLTHEIALTAHYLSGLVYLCVLERIGVDSDTRMKLCRENRIVNH
ncbi:MAG: hypothetical protein IJJ69_02125 [Oscillospiraceae bacterium]|nr:hypothetical protein [Oscillospiraceae bacterium]